jgi:hypothetical protein
MAIESDGHSRGNPRIYELIENAPKTGKSPTIWAWPEVMDWFRVAGQPVPGPWPPHQQPRPNPEEESLPVAVVEPTRPADTPAPRRGYVPEDTPAPSRGYVPEDAPAQSQGHGSEDTPAQSQGYVPEDTPAPSHGYGSADEPPARHGIGLMD